MEVLKGPQGTLYGRNTIGGAINVITRQPTKTPEAYARAGIGNYNLIQTEGAVSGPLIEDKLLARASFYTLDQDGYTRNLTTGGPLNGNDTSAIRLKLRALPTERLTIDLNGSYTRDRTSGYAGDPLGPSVIFASPSAPAPLRTADRYTNYYSFDPTTSRDVVQTSARFEWEGDAVSLTSITGYRDALVKEHQENDQTNLDSFEQFTREHSRSFTQELRLASAGSGKLEWIAGLFYLHDKTARDDTFVTGVDSIFSSLQTSFLDTGVPNIAARGRIRSRYPVELDARTESIAAFGQVKYDITDSLGLTIGLRFTRDSKKASYDVGSDALPGLGLVALPFAVDLKRSWTSWDPKVVLDYKLADDILAYASFAEGFKSGGFQFGTATPQGTSIIFDPEKVRSYEIGLKSTFADGAVRFNAAAFRYDYTNLQVPRVLQVAGGRIDNITTNAAESTIKGLEVELNAALSRRLEVGLQYAYLDAKYDEYIFIPGVQDFSGNRMVRAPKHTLSGSAEYRLPVGSDQIGVRGDFFHSSRVFFEPDQGAMEQAIAGCVAAQRQWWALPAAAREKALFAAAELIEARRAELVELLINEGGSTFGKAQFEVGAAADMVRGAAGECRRITGETLPSDTPGQLSMSVRRPLGTVAAIMPFNFPLLLGAKKTAFALAAGNAVVAKPSPHTPVIGLKLGEIFNEAGLPEGLVSVLPADAVQFADLVIAHPSVAMLTFTGSSAVGRELAAKAGARLKRVALELGGKSPMIVLADADLDHAIDAACFGAVHHQGQVCMANTRLIVEAPVYEAFAAGLARKLASLKTGDPHDPDTVIGPLIDKSKIARLHEQIADARTNGARVLCGGDAEGAVFAPTVVADVTPAMRLFGEECFAPVVCVSRADDHRHALVLANQSSFGLSSAVMTRDLGKALELAEGLEAGMVHVNDSSIYDEPLVPFGGVKASGLGREGGRHSIEAMTELKWITVAREPRHYPF